MAIVFADGFDDWSFANYAQEAWSYANGVNSLSFTTGRRASTNGLVNSTSAAGGQYAGLSRSLGSSNSTIFAHFAFQCGVRPTVYARTLISFREATGQHVTIAMNTSGQLFAARGGAAGTVLGTGSTVIPTATWYSVEVKVLVSDTVGTVEVRINGAVELNLSGLDTRNAGASGVIDTIQLGDIASPGTTSNTWQFYWDDLVIYNTTGSVCSTWTGDIRVDSILPSGAGSSTQFTPSAGSNYQCVDDASANTTDYVDSSTAGHIDLYEAADLAHTPTNIYGVLMTALATKDDAGARSLKLKMKSSSTTGDSSAMALTNASWERKTALFETDPNTSAAWTKANLNAAEIGIECV